MNAAADPGLINPGSVGILTALPLEASALVRIGALRPGAPIAAADCGAGQLLVSGMGAARAREAVRTLRALGLRRVLNVGFAGGLREGCRTGALYMPRQVCAGQDDTILLDDGDWWRALRAALQACGEQPLAGSLYSAPAPLLSPGPRRAVHCARQLDLVDLEGHAIADEALTLGMEVVLLKVVLDQWNSRLPPCVFRCVDPWGRPRWLEFIPDLLYHPRQFLQLWRLLCALRAARLRLRRLGRALAERMPERQDDAGAR